MGLPPHHMLCLDRGVGALVKLNQNTRMHRSLDMTMNLHDPQRRTHVAELVVVLSANKNIADERNAPVVYVLTTLGTSWLGYTYNHTFNHWFPHHGEHVLR